ncbi:DUF58 domain-containing protein [Ornithinimicrobium pekingense]|uniref:DUF58 domain-containing protein n=1 Tax=Ornithinimicrobium pekingense TaxID=384677 RepID=A0ABQ2F9Q6_9MICO|nr:DUF58 domain-containing protein [Ornithinimicrobium pekingense]GGK66546.1 hypothetical protein GCM10011509_13530 [Ornithinimicrobium pekingense]
MSTARADRWQATPALVRSLVLVLGAVPVALLWRRPDLLVLVAPIAVVLVWSVVTRPRELPTRTVGLSHAQVREGEQALAVADVQAVAGAEILAAALSPAPYVEGVPTERTRRVDDADGLPVSHTSAVVDAQGPPAAGTWRLVVGVRATRWGVRRVGPMQLAAVGAWGSYRWGPVSEAALGLRTLPQPTVFDTRAPAPRPRGLVGTHRSARPGEGTEFATLRPFQVGDRLRRIHWPRSTRGDGQLYVTASYADQDTHVAVLVDAHYDLGSSGGVRGRPSSLDRSVRAAAAVAEHFLQQGDRVSLRVLSARTPLTVPVGTGRRHGVRILDTLCRIVPAATEETDPRRVHLGVDEGTLVVMVSALVSPDALVQAAVLARRGLSVVVVDALVDSQDGTVAPSAERDALARAAWRIRMLERDREIRAIQAQGVPVVPWLGPGSLDVVLRRLGRRGRAAGRLS